MKVLVVDDSRAMRRIMRKALAFAGLENERVLEAEHGAAALELVRENAPELVLSDVNMPVMSGDMFLDAMRDEGHLASSRVVMVTSTVGATKALDLVRRGATKVLRKPFDPLSLHSQLRDLFESGTDTSVADSLDEVPEEVVELDAAAPPAVFDEVAESAASSSAPPFESGATAAPLDPQAPPRSVEPQASTAPDEPMAGPSFPPAPYAVAEEVAPAAQQTYDEEFLAEAALEATRHVLDVSLMEPSSPAIATVAAERMLLVSTIEMYVPVAAELSLLCTYDVATRLASSLCGEPPSGDDQARFDALGEVLNMVAGRFADQVLPGGVGPNMFGLPYVGVILPGEAPVERWRAAELDGAEGEALFVRFAAMEGS